jgi:hypothetical protein
MLTAREDFEISMLQSRVAGWFGQAKRQVAQFEHSVAPSRQCCRAHYLQDQRLQIGAPS